MISVARIDRSVPSIAIGMDSKGRLMEMVAIYQSDSIESRSGKWLIYHAMTMTSENIIQELRTARN